MRYLVECTYVFDHPQDNTGIQRVVRNVINNLKNLEFQPEPIPIVFKNKKVYRVSKLEPGVVEGHLANARTVLNKARHQHWLLHHKLHYAFPFSKWTLLRKPLHILFRLLSLWHLVPMKFIEVFFRSLSGSDRLVEISVESDDVLILLDSSWHYTFFEEVERYRRDGTAVVGVVYDLIPLTHPQFCDDGLVKVFEKWFGWLIDNVDGIVCISKSVAGSVRQFSSDKKRFSCKQNDFWLDYFYLGTDLDLSGVKAEIARDVRNVFDGGRPVYLMVSTIEPRKNHQYLLNSFELVWQQGLDVSLCFVGKIGWRCAELIDRIETHPELGRRLFLLSGLSDTELEYCYEQSKCLLFSSYAEGFGLPLVESLDRGLPVMASDIPVFKEIGGSWVQYFDLDHPQSLVDLVFAFEQEGGRSVDGWKWMSWRESAEMLLEKVDFNLDKRRSVQRCN